MPIESEPATNGRVSRLSNARLPTRIGTFDATVFSDSRNGTEPIAFVHGEIGRGDAPLVRLHSECLTGDVLGSLRCDCGAQLGRALTAIVAEGAGVLLYLRQEGRGIGLANKLRLTRSRTAGSTPSPRMLHSACRSTPASTEPPQQSSRTWGCSRSG